ncbi:MAG: CDP-archaeol synthase [Methyloceanibacter sp.]
MQPVLVLELLILLTVANGTPVVAKRLFGSAFAQPLDGGALFADGRPWFGPSNTIRGVVLATLATAAAAGVLGLGWKVGALLGVVAMAGDLLASFIKRRLGLAPSSQAVGLDQIPESLLPMLAGRLFMPVTGLDIAVTTLLFFVGELVLSRLLYKWHVRDRPY